MDLLAKVELDNVSGLARDTVSMSFAISDVDTATENWDSNIANAFSTFINSTPTNGLAAMKSFLSPEVKALNGLHVKLYDITGKLAGGPANAFGSPVFEEPAPGWNINAGTALAGTGLPAEVAVCVTLEGLGRDTAPVEAPDSGDAGTESDRPKQRRTGRFFFGPLNTTVLSSVNGQVRPGENILDTVRLAVDDLKTAIFVAGGGAELAVWSRKAAALYPVVAVSVDNAFDTIRSRGCAPTIRQRDLI